VLLYELLIGRPPFGAVSALDTLMQVVADDVPPPRQARPAIGRDLEAVCLKCLEKFPQQRYPSAAALADDLGRHLRGEPVQARPASLARRATRWTQQRPALAATVCALSLFYGNHLLLMNLGMAEGGAWHWFVTGLVACWIGGAVGFHWLRGRPRLHWPATYGWAALDVVMFTILLLRGAGPHSTLLGCYPLLIAGAALRFREGLVWLVTGLCSASYVVLLLDARLRRPELAVEIPPAVIFLLVQLVMGVLMTLLLRRFRQELAREANCPLRSPDGPG
jgi:serine/threonine-protein kinase